MADGGWRKILDERGEKEVDELPCLAVSHLALPCLNSWRNSFLPLFRLAGGVPFLLSFPLFNRITHSLTRFKYL